ncbi:hypothetical protein ALC57_04018 [Trachymyrmex cornetzi]|uniref:Uncharacterized protein n=1 Tax=Trachymyrmex cornetzi TaxID=471704 RepID=A0A151JF30_9HYME|nr:hypothetical protein ALC57_04018 [Trachymyrmex cornetzi]
MKSYPKGTKSTSHRTSKPHKRKFHGNRFTNNENDDELDTSSSARKLSTADGTSVIVNPLHCYRIIEFLTVFGAFTDILVCSSCKQKVRIEESGHRGLGFKIIVSCRCGQREINSGPLINTGFEINRRIVFVMRLLGIGQEGINVFCGLMDLCNGLARTTYDNIVQHIYSASVSMFEEMSKKAITEERQKNAQHGRIETHLKVSGDGSWKKQGFTFLYGITTLIAYYSGKVIDLLVKSAYCAACNNKRKELDDEEFEEWYEKHQETCTSNHEGSAGKMEVDSIMEMFLRSEENFGVQYRNYIGDGDSKTFAGILNSNPYGDDCPVTKNECVSYVQKRMGTRLRNLRKKEKLGGKNRLTESLIKKLIIYYGLAIRRNVESVIEDMKNAVIATLDHYCSTHKSPRHENLSNWVPPGADSWCDWRKAEAANQLSSYKHAARVIDKDVEKHIRPIYEDLSIDHLLTRCLGGHTQNSNESLNATVWRMALKHLHSGKNSFGNIKYPVVSKVVKALLSLSHGNADVERGFSTSALILTDNRASMSEKTLNSYMIVKYALKMYNNLPQKKYDEYLEEKRKKEKQEHETRVNEEIKKEEEKKRLEREELKSNKRNLKTEKKELTELRQFEDAKTKQADKLLEEASQRLIKGVEKENMEEIALAEAMLVGVTKLRNEAQEKRKQIRDKEKDVNKRKNNVLDYFTKKSKNN